jgi:hypothetical protein
MAQPVTSADWKKRCGTEAASFGGRPLSSNYLQQNQTLNSLFF